MNAQPEIRIIQLEPLRVASALGFGPSPEPLSSAMLMEWIGARGLSDEISKQRFFGFNNPNPSAGSSNYGYEQWMTVGEEVESRVDEEVQVKVFPGGSYAVMRCNSIPNPETWGKLVTWMENSRYRFGQHQWLEECLTPGLITGEPGFDESQAVFDLYLPISE